MTESAAHPELLAAPRQRYMERLRTPWWWYPAGLFVGALLGAEFAFIVPLWLTWLPITLSLLLAIVIVWRLSSASVRVIADQLVAGDRSLPISEIAQAIDLSSTELRRVVGRHGDPLAYNFIRSWVGPGVQLVLFDGPDDEALPDYEATGEATGEATEEATEETAAEATGKAADEVSAAAAGEAPTAGAQFVSSDNLDDYDVTEPRLARMREPYWLISTRHPRELIAAIQAASSNEPLA